MDIRNSKSFFLTQYRFSKRLKPVDKTNQFQLELKTLEWNILNHDHLIWLSNGHTLDFLINPLFGYFYCIKVTFDNNYKYNAISIGLISERIKVSCSQAGF